MKYKEIVNETMPTRPAVKIRGLISKPVAPKLCKPAKQLPASTSPMTLCQHAAIDPAITPAKDKASLKGNFLCECLGYVPIDANPQQHKQHGIGKRIKVLRPAATPIARLSPTFFNPSMKK